ncbi:hypothetical protein AXW83_24480 [Bosea sp. PAMC 26642]|nr:hypothetical protein AXW83_24480 [Bosea sp. PAMC 26642]
MSLLMIDLDKFKNINDTYGHIAGDDVLKMFASHGKSVFRATDLFARIGGEEFVALLVGTDKPGGLLVAERLRSSIAELNIRTRAGVIRVTASVGLTAVTMKDRSVTSPLRRADKALYRAKESGRNRVEVAA